MRRKFDLDQLKQVVEDSRTKGQVLKALGLKPAGGNYAMLKHLIETHEIDTSHFVGQSWRKGQSFPPRRQLKDYLKDDSPTSSHALRLRLLREGVFDPKCYSCDQTHWLGQPIPLELEHLNGIHRDNRLENLTLLCPNCHALSPTYRSRNRKQTFTKAEREARARYRWERAKNNSCLTCGNPCVEKFCSLDCLHLGQRRVDRPTRDELAAMVASMSMVAIGRKYGVSDNAVRKWLKAHGLR